MQAKLTHTTVSTIWHLPSRTLRSQVPDLRAQLLQFIPQIQQCLWIDLEHVKQIDASGLSLLLTAYELLEPRAIDVLLMAPAAQALQLIEESGLHLVFPIMPGPSSASALGAEETCA